MAVSPFGGVLGDSVDDIVLSKAEPQVRLTNSEEMVRGSRPAGCLVSAGVYLGVFFKSRKKKDKKKETVE